MSRVVSIMPDEAFVGRERISGLKITLDDKSGEFFFVSDNAFTTSEGDYVKQGNLYYLNGNVCNVNPLFKELNYGNTQLSNQPITLNEPQGL